MAIAAVRLKADVQQAQFSACRCSAFGQTAEQAQALPEDVFGIQGMSNYA